MIVEAGLVSFFRTLLIITLIYYGVKLMVKFLFPLFLKRYAEKHHSSFSQSSGTSSSRQDTRTPKNPKEKLGEYVDFEEVE